MVKSVKLAPTAPCITHSMYADDLVIFGQATREEEGEIGKLMEEFGLLSGLRMNPQKSKIRFSESTSQQSIEQVLATIQVEEEGESTAGKLVHTRKRIISR